MTPTMQRIALICASLIAILHADGLEFTNTLAEIHAPPDAQTVTADFEFTNRSDKPVQVKKYDAACSCMAVKIKDSKLRYAPGESGLIRADFAIGNFTGTVDKIVALWIDDDPASKPSVKLTVRVHIPAVVELDPKTLKWELGGKAAPQSIRITMHDDRPIHVTGVMSSSPAFQTELKTLQEGKSYELVVTPTEMNTPGLGVLRFETDAPNTKDRVQQAFAVVRMATPGEAAAKP
jgi:hypothetical protein